MPAEHSLDASLRIAIISGVGCDPPSLTSSSLSMLPCDLHRRPSTVSAQRRPRTRYMFVVAAVVSVALSLLCPLTVAAGRTQPLRRLACHRSLWGGGMRWVLLYVVVVVAVAPQSPLSPIPGIRQTQTLDTSVNVIIVNAIVDVPPLPTASRRTGMACPAPPTLCRRRSRCLHVLARALTSLALVANNDAMLSILSCGSMSNESAPPRTKEIISLPPLRQPPPSPFPSSPPLQGCSPQASWH